VRSPGDECIEPSLYDQLAQALRARDYSVRTQRAYVGWAKRFIATPTSSTVGPGGQEPSRPT
jgi:hypothetical protein